MSDQPGPAAAAIGKIESAFGAAGLQPSRVNVGPAVAVVGTTSRFRWRWIATKLNVCMYAAWFLPATPVEMLDQYLAAACQDAIDRKGAMRGMQTGVAAITVAILDSATPEQVAWASTPHGRRFAALTFPVMVDASTRRVVRPERMVLGGIYTGYLKELVSTHIEGPITH